MSAELIQEIREHPADQKPWAAWYKAVYPKVYYAAYRLANGDVDAAQDLTQETFMRFLNYRAIDRVESDRHALAFLFMTCRNLAFDRIADARRIPEQSIDDLESIAGTEAPVEPTLDFESIIRELEPQDRQLMQWVRDGLSVSEIARQLGISYTAAGVRLHRIKKRLRRTHG